MRLWFLDINVLKNILKDTVKDLDIFDRYEQFTIIPPEGINSNYYLNKEELLNNSKNLFLSIVFKKRIFLEDNELFENNDVLPDVFIVSKEIFNWFLDKINNSKIFKGKVERINFISFFTLNLEEIFFRLLKIFTEYCAPKFSNPILGSNSFYFVGEGSLIGKQTIIYPFVYIGNNVFIGDNVLIYPNVSIYDNVYIGNNVVIHSNTTIGADGFGYTDNLEKIYQIGGVVIKDNVEIGANVSIDRATIGYTFISQNTKIDNQVQVGHNVKIGKNCRIVSKVGIAGSARIYDNCIIAAMSGIKDGIKIGPNTILAGNTMATKNLEPNKIYAGYPAKEFSKHFKDLAILQKIIDSYNLR